MTTFFPALAHTDALGYLDESGNRNLMSVRRLLPRDLQERALISLSFDESVHYEVDANDGDPSSSNIDSIECMQLSEIFVDCGAFHYTKLEVPKFPNGGFVRSSSAFREAKARHIDRNPSASYLLCSPDHIIHPGLTSTQILRRREFTRRSAKSFLELCKDYDNVTPICAIHGLTSKDRVTELRYMVELGYDYVAFGGLVPLARYTEHVLELLAGIKDLESPVVTKDSPLGIAKDLGLKVHIFGLNSPEWYRWWKRLGVTSFDGSKLSQEGAANGIIWQLNETNQTPRNAKDMYNRLQIKKIRTREWGGSKSLKTLIVSSDGELSGHSDALEYLQSARCTSPRCPNSSFTHSCDPRVTGSIEHNMGRMILNAHVFSELMARIDKFVELASISDLSGENTWLRNWTPIEVGDS